MEMTEERDEEFCMEMRMEDEDLVHCMSGMSLMGEMPRLGRDHL